MKKTSKKGNFSLFKFFQSDQNSFKLFYTKGRETLKSKMHPQIEKNPFVSQLPFTLNGYRFESVLGSGSFSTVFKVLHESSKLYFAAKSMPLDRQTKIDVIGAEIESLMHLYHPNIIKIYETFKAENYIFIIIEWCSGMNIKEVIETQGQIHPDQLLSFYRQILSAISYCHQRRVAHRDIKPANIFVEKNGRCVVGDFGLSCIEIDKATEFCGSLAYKPPEILQKKAYNPLAADIWSLGVTFYVMATGKSPWQTSQVMPIERCIISGDFYLPPSINKDIAHLLRSMIVVDPDKRRSAEELVNLPMFDKTPNLVPFKSYTEKRVPLCVRSNSVTKRSICKPKPNRSSSKTTFFPKRNLRNIFIPTPNHIPATFEEPPPQPSGSAR